MEEVVEVEGSPASEVDQDPRFAAAREASGGDYGREMLEHAAQGAQLDDAEERAGLEWLLGSPQPYVHEIPVDYETPDGMAKLTFVARTIDTRRIDKLEQSFVSDAARGRVDQISLDLAVVAEAVTEIVDSHGNRVDVTSEKFRTVQRRNERGEFEPHVLAATTDALEFRFKHQLGLMAGISQEIRRAAGFDPQRVGKAQRRLVEGSLG